MKKIKTMFSYIIQGIMKESFTQWWSTNQTSTKWTITSHLKLQNTKKILRQIMLEIQDMVWKGTIMWGGGGCEMYVYDQ